MCINQPGFADHIDVVSKEGRHIDVGGESIEISIVVPQIHHLGYYSPVPLLHNRRIKITDGLYGSHIGKIGNTLGIDHNDIRQPSRFQRGYDLLDTRTPVVLDPFHLHVGVLFVPCRHLFDRERLLDADSSEFPYGESIIAPSFFCLGLCSCEQCCAQHYEKQHHDHQFPFHSKPPCSGKYIPTPFYVEW